MKHYFYTLLRLTLLCLTFVWSGAVAYAQESCYSRAIASCILNDGSGNYPIEEAGEVFVATSADAVPAWQSGSFTTETIVNTGNPKTGTVKQVFYCWARAKEGYNFIGWGTTSTSKTTTGSSANYENQAWSSSSTTVTHWSAGSPDAPIEKKLYAIFEKNTNFSDEPADKGDGVAFNHLEGTTNYVAGSTSKDWFVRVVFNEPLAYKSFAGYNEGYGVNADLVKFITCQSETHTVKVSSVKVSGSVSANGSDAYGLIAFPYTMEAGIYNVHLPYGLFTTSSEKPTSAC